MKILYNPKTFQCKFPQLDMVPSQESQALGPQLEPGGTRRNQEIMTEQRPLKNWEPDSAQAWAAWGIRNMLFVRKHKEKIWYDRCRIFDNQILKHISYPQKLWTKMLPRPSYGQFSVSFNEIQGGQDMSSLTCQPVVSMVRFHRWARWVVMVNGNLKNQPKNVKIHELKNVKNKFTVTLLMLVWDGGLHKAADPTEMWEVKRYTKQLQMLTIV